MRRSEINQLMTTNAEFIRAHGFHLPPFAFWSPQDWRAKGEECADICRAQMGWDITDFGSGDYKTCGLFLFTIRNGVLDGSGNAKSYAEKVMVVDEGQLTPTHYHFRKMEDIINRGGGTLTVRLWNAAADDRLDDTPVTVQVDGVRRELPAGGRLVLTPGESVTLTPRLYHAFWGTEGSGRVLVGEVSRVNDDHTDNRFLEPVGRFPAIVEDEEPVHLLVSDYAGYYRYV